MALILLVEDNELNRDMLSRRLLRRGYQLRYADCGAAALREVEAELPDLILMDIGLPDIDGWEVTQRLKASPKTASIPVIALTARAFASDEARSLSVGCAFHETKPVRLGALLAKMNSLLSARGVEVPNVRGASVGGAAQRPQGEVE